MVTYKNEYIIYEYQNERINSQLQSAFRVSCDPAIRNIIVQRQWNCADEDEPIIFQQSFCDQK